jgi:ergothioneine biosynthesis protein EgtB
MQTANLNIKNTSEILNLYLRTRERTLDIADPLEIEDMVIQANSDCSPVKWHLAHTTWFFEKFIASKFITNYETFDRSFDYLFNSYYEGIGRYFPKERRGTVSRPTVSEVLKYRKYIDSVIENLLKNGKASSEVLDLIELGINHEEQHQELMLMDIKMAFFNHPDYPAYRNDLKTQHSKKKVKQSWHSFDEGLFNVGFDGSGFCFDNETPSHKEWLNSFSISSRLVTNEEFLNFIMDEGYQRPELWLSDGWSWVKSNNIRHPLYWVKERDDYSIFTLSGLQKMILSEPVSHISFFEADAFARWSGNRLPSEPEWERAFYNYKKTGRENFMESDYLKPTSCSTAGLSQGFGDLWEWTQSPYLPYPGSKPAEGEIGEYNHKFMSGQMVLKGGSYGTPRDHIRLSYRNYFQPEKRWAFTGIRLARDR